MYKTIIAITYLFLFSFLSLAHAQSNKGWVDDTEANDIMIKLAKKYAGIKTVSAEVKISTEDKTSQKKEEKKVSVLLSNPKYRLIYGNQIIYCDGKSMWHYNKDAQEVTLTNADSTELEEMNFQKLITQWKKNYRPKLIREEDQNGNIFQIIDLTPVKRKEYHKIRISINKNKQELTLLEIHFYDKNKTTYSFQSYKINPTVKDSDFSFDASANPTAEVIDIR